MFKLTVKKELPDTKGFDIISFCKGTETNCGINRVQENIKVCINNNLFNSIKDIKSELGKIDFKNEKIIIDLNSLKAIDNKYQENLKLLVKTISLCVYKNNFMKSDYKKAQWDITLVTDDKIEDNKILKINNLINSIEISRTLQDYPPNIATPSFIAETYLKQFKDLKNIKIKVFDKKELQSMGMNLLLAVNSGSLNEPKMVLVEYKPVNEDEFDFGLVGKGITMDTGGYNLKIGSNQSGMKFDMSGASIILSTILTMAKNNEAKNVIGAAMLTENCIGNGSTLVESVVKSFSGKTVEINNTDAEGRLVLADGLSFINKEFKPKVMIDVATLTGSVKKALGVNLSGVFTNDLQLFEPLNKIGLKNNEPMWILPIQDENYTNMLSSIADYKNASTNPDFGVGNAAAFLENFVKGTKYIHLDIAGTADFKGKSTGVMVDTLVDYMTAN